MIELVVGASSELPASWMVAAIEDIAVLSPKFGAEGMNAGDLVHFVPMTAVAENFGGIDISRLRSLDEVRKGYTSFAEADVLFAKITPCMENGKGALVPPLPHKYAFGSTEFHVLRPSAAVSSKWLAHYLSQPDFRKIARRNMIGTAGQMRVPSSWLASAGIPLAPIAEQTRIVEKLEELLSDLDAGVAELKAAQRKLAQYHQSLLKAAVEGTLTADWRAARQESQKRPDPSSRRRLSTAEGVVKPRSSALRSDATNARSKSPDSRLRGNDDQKGNAPDCETGANLLQRILTERRGRWETRQLAKFAEQGKTPPKDWKAKYNEPATPESVSLPAIPPDWTWASIEQIASDERYSLAIGPFGSNLKVPDYREEGVPLVFVRNIRSGNYGGDYTKYVTSEKASELSAHGIQPGDVLITKMGEPPGDADVYPYDQPPAVITADCIKVRCGREVMQARFLVAVINSSIGKQQIKPITQGVAQKKVSLGRFSLIAVPLPGMEEQQEICARLVDVSKEIDAQSAAVEHSLKQATAQRKNILKAAFVGQLVPQDPNDEPASALLERIRAGQSAEGNTTARKRSRKAEESA